MNSIYLRSLFLLGICFFLQISQAREKRQGSSAAEEFFYAENFIIDDHLLLIGVSQSPASPTAQTFYTVHILENDIPKGEFRLTSIQPNTLTIEAFWKQLGRALSDSILTAFGAYLNSEKNHEFKGTLDLLAQVKKGTPLKADEKEKIRQFIQETGEHLLYQSRAFEGALDGKLDSLTKEDSIWVFQEIDLSTRTSIDHQNAYQERLKDFASSFIMNAYIASLKPDPKGQPTGEIFAYEKAKIYDYNQIKDKERDEAIGYILNSLVDKFKVEVSDATFITQAIPDELATILSEKKNLGAILKKAYEEIADSILVKGRRPEPDPEIRQKSIKGKNFEENLERDQKSRLDSIKDNFLFHFFEEVQLQSDSLTSRHQLEIKEVSIEFEFDQIKNVKVIGKVPGLKNTVRLGDPFLENEKILREAKEKALSQSDVLGTTRNSKNIQKLVNQLRPPTTIIKKDTLITLLDTFYQKKDSLITWMDTVITANDTSLVKRDSVIVLYEPMIRTSERTIKTEEVTKLSAEIKVDNSENGRSREEASVGSTANETFVFQNRVPISYSTKRDISRDVFLDALLSNKEVKLFYNRPVYGKSLYINFSDVFYNDYKLLNKTENYSPYDTVITIKPGDPGTILLKEKTVNILQAKVFSDFVGFDQDQPNGLIQTEISKRVYLNSSIIQLGKNYAYWGFVNSVNPKLNISKIEENNRSLLLEPLADTLGGRTHYIPSMDFFRHQNFSVGGEVNLVYFGFPKIHTVIYINTGIMLRRSSVAFPIPVDSLNEVPIEPDPFNVTSVSIWPEIDISLNPHPSYSFAFDMKYSSFRILNDNFLQVNSPRQFFDTGKDVPSDIITFKFTGMIKPNRNAPGSLFFRWLYSYIPQERNQNFLQAQVGYSFNILSNKN